MVVLSAAMKAGISHYQFDHRTQPDASQLANLVSELANHGTPATRLRILQMGDTWHSTVKGQIQMASGQSVPVTGKCDELVLRSTQGEPGPLEDFLSSTLTLPNGKSIQHIVIKYFRQDAATGDIMEMGDNDGPRETTRQVINPQVTLPGSWSVGLTLSPWLLYAAGQTDRRSMRVTGIESVATGAGTLAAWKSSETSKGGTIQSTVWYAPQIGGAVAEHDVSRDEDGTTISLDVILDSTNVSMH